MTTEYLEQAKIDETAEQLRDQGYEVASRPDSEYDIVATRNGATMAIEIKARSALAESVEEIARMRADALARGYDEFRLIVVNPPRSKRVEINGLERKLALYLAGHLPAEIRKISGSYQLLGVNDVDIDRLIVTKENIEVTGDGRFDIELEPGDDGGLTARVGLPLTFEALLDHQLNVISAKPQVDVSSLYDAGL